MILEIEEPGSDGSSDSSLWGLSTSAPCIPDASSRATLHIFDRGAAWVPAENLREARQMHGAVQLPDGRILVLGGAGASGQGLRQRRDLRSGNRALDRHRLPAPRPSGVHLHPAAERQGLGRRWRQGTGPARLGRNRRGRALRSRGRDVQPGWRSRRAAARPYGNLLALGTSPGGGRSHDPLSASCTTARCFTTRRPGPGHLPAP